MQVMEPGVEFSLDTYGPNAGESLPLIFVHEVDGVKKPGTTSEEVLLALISRHTHLEVNSNRSPIDNPHVKAMVQQKNYEIVELLLKALELQKQTIGILLYPGDMPKP